MKKTFKKLSKILVVGFAILGLGLTTAFASGDLTWATTGAPSVENSKEYIGKITDTVDELLGKNSSLVGQVEELTLANGNLTTTNEEQAADILEFESQVGDLTTTNEEQAEDIVEFGIQVEELTTTNEDHEASLEAAVTDVEAIEALLSTLSEKGLPVDDEEEEEEEE